MSMTVELKYTLAAAAVTLVLIGAYGLRVAIKGRAHSQRIDRQGGSRLLSRGAMEIGYWVLAPVARLLVFLGITPNQVSWTSLGFGFLAGAYLAAGHFGFGAICATICGLLDSVDGMVARSTGLASDAGEVLDAAVDRYVEFFFLSGLVIYYRAIPELQILALFALLGSFMVSYSTAKAEALSIDPPKGIMRRPERAVYLTLGAALSALSIPWIEETQRQFAVPVGYPMAMALGLVAVLANLSSINRLRRIAKAIRIREKQSAEIETAERATTEASGRRQIVHRPADLGL
jgi:CDP-diacylglycerol--glycerol-3-phosphate 3-phosphatidyltransferase